MKGKAIIVKGLSETQLNILVNYLRINNYRWLSSELDVLSIIRGEVLYMENDKRLTFSGLGCLDSNKQYYKLVEFNSLIKMKKTDLKPGMVVEYANGDKRLVATINNELYLIGEHMFATLASFSDDLTCDTNPDVNIVKVFQPKEASSLSSLLDCKNCIWERPKETVLTMQEIADKFGIPVEQLKIKK
jgi:hypothetical protein